MHWVREDAVLVSNINLVAVYETQKILQLISLLDCLKVFFLWIENLINKPKKCVQVYKDFLGLMEH